MASIKTLAFLAWILFGFGTLVYAVLATEYNRFIIFKEPIPDKAIPDHVIRTEKVAIEGSCRVECYLEPNCVSINVGPAEEGGHTCELNNATEESSSQSVLKTRWSYTHYAIENICHLHGDPCPGVNNLCQVGFTDKGYRCKCRDGYEHEGNECKECQNALGMETRQIPDVQISASSEWNNLHAANQGRLHFKADGVKAGSWAAKKNDGNQWLQIDLGNQHTRITGVATQGRNGKCCQQWVTKYKLQYSNHTVNFKYYKENGQTAEKVFDGNTDNVTVVRHNLSTPIKARYIRFRPEEWHNHISMRVELYGCQANWKKINDDPVCFGARDDSYGVFNISQSGLIYTFKLVYRGGALKCTSSGTPSYWGCWHNSMTLATVIAHPNKTVLPLAKYGKSAYGCQYTYAYKIDGVNVKATELVFNNLPSPMTVSTGQEFQIWFGQDLADCTEENNSGQTCADVYAWYA